MTLDAILIVNGEETTPGAPGFLSRTRAALKKYREYEDDRPFIVTPTGESQDYLLNNDVADEDLIEEQGKFRFFLTEMGADNKHYARTNSCDTYTSLLFGIHETKFLLESERLGIATDANLAVPHIDLARQLATSEVIDIPSNHSVPLSQANMARAELAALEEDFNKYGARKDDFHSHRRILRRHPEIAQCYGEKPRGNYASFRTGVVYDDT